MSLLEAYNSKCDANQLISKKLSDAREEIEQLKRELAAKDRSFAVLKTRFEALKQKTTELEEWRYGHISGAVASMSYIPMINELASTLDIFMSHICVKCGDCAGKKCKERKTTEALVRRARAIVDESKKKED